MMGSVLTHPTSLYPLPPTPLSAKAVKTFDERGDFTVTVYVSNLHGGVSTDAIAVDVKALNSGCPECGNDCVHGTCSASQASLGAAPFGGLGVCEKQRRCTCLGL